MGYGGIIKTVFKIAAGVVGGLVCGPPCAAVGTALATGATGGSFKEALMAGATSFIGSTVTQSFSNLANASAGANAISSGAIDPFSGTQTFADIGLGGLPEGLAAKALTSGTLNTGGSFIGDLLAEGVSTPISDVPIIGDISDAIGSQFNVGDFGNVLGKVRSGADFLMGSGSDSLFDLGFDLIPLQINSAADLAAAGVGSLTELTLNQALNADIEGLDEVLGQKFNPQQIQTLRDEARNALSQQAFDNLIGSTPNPGLSTAEFNKIIASGIERENIRLGPSITETQFSNVFDNPNLGQTILSDETNLRKQSFANQVSGAFPGSPFGDIDQGIIDSIVQERSGPARQEIANFGARGNLNPTGGRTANIILDEQTIGAANRVNQVGEQVLGQNRNDIGAIRDQARSTVSGYKLGDDLFNVTPFADERSSLIDARNTSFQGDVTSALGSEPLFNISSALSGAGRAQGVVSGAPSNKSFLDVLAARSSGVSSGRNNRGIGVAGSGAF